MKRLRSFLVFFISLLIVSAAGGQDRGTASAGVLDLSSHDFELQGVTGLDGDWFIFWNAVIDPQEVADADLGELATSADGVFSMPHTWNGWEIEGEPVGGIGYATFVVDLLLPPSMEEAALWIPNASTAYTLWVDGVQVARSGTPGSSRSDSRPHYMMNTARFAPGAGGRSRITLQVSNFHHRRGGMWKSIRIGTPEQVNALDVLEMTYDFLLLGSFIALGLFNFFLYWNTRGTAGSMGRGRAVPLLLSLAFGALVVRVMVTGQILITRVIPTFPWSIQLRLEYLSAMVVFVTFAWICERAYPGVIPRVVIRFITLFVAANAVIPLLFPVIVYSRIVTSYNIIKSITLLGMTVRFILWAGKGHKEGWAMVGAIMIFFLITFGETLHYREVVLSRDFAPVGFILSLVNTGANETVLYLFSTLATLGTILVVFNLFVLKVSLAFLKHEERLTPIHLDTLEDDHQITPREREILQLVATGKSNKEIAGELYISEGTVKNHLYRIMRKLGVSNRTEIAVRLASHNSD